MSSSFNPKTCIVRLFPILQWSRKYNVETALGDLIGGVTVALTLIPQSMAYSSLAGFDPQYGLYASFMGGYVYAFMGTCAQVNIGPSALLALLTFTHTNGTNIDFAILLCFMSGIIQLVIGIAQLGCLMDFVSVPVVSGFTSAAAIMVASAQIKGLLGIKFSAANFMDTWIKIFKHIGETRITDTVLSLCCCALLVLMQNLKYIPFKIPQNDREKRRTAVRKRILWLIAVSANATVVILASVASYFMFKSVNDPFFLTGPVTPGLPSPRPPPFETAVDGKVYTARDMLSHLGVGLLVVPLIAFLINVAIAKAFARGKRVDANQEILALGACNIVSSFFISMPVNGSISRSAVSDASGVRTPGAGFYTSTLVMLTLLLLTPYFFYIPRAALASVIVCAVLHMVEIEILRKIWEVSKLDLIPLFGCFFCCLGLGVEIGLLCGVAFDVILLLYYNSRPPLDIRHVTDGSLPPHYAIHPVGRLSFAGAERVRSKLVAITESDVISVPVSDGADTRARPAKVFVVYCGALYRMDYTFLQSLKMLESDWRSNFRIIFCDARPSVKEQLRGVMSDAVYCDSGELRTYLTSTPEQQSASKNTTV